MLPAAITAQQSPPRRPRPLLPVPRAPQPGPGRPPLLGGAVRDRVPIYHTCTEYRGVSDKERLRQDPIGFAHELWEAGIRCLKVSPFDAAAHESSGQFLSTARLAQALRPLEQLAASLDGRMDIMIEAHGLWAAGPAAQIARALDGLPVRWIEDPLAQDNVDEWARLREKSPVPIAGGERLQTRHQLHKLLQAGGVDFLISDLTWSGGITEGRRTAELADLYGVGFATHGNSGPVNQWAAAHVLTSVRNAYAAETVRLHWDPDIGYFDSVVEGPQVVHDGYLQAPVSPGLGITLRPGLAVAQHRTTVAR